MEDDNPDISVSNAQPSNRRAGALHLGDEMRNASTVHTNVGQDVIVIDASKVRLLLYKKYESLKIRRDWTTPVGIFLALLIVQVSADFKQAWGLDAPTWHALFILSSVASGIWSAICLYKAWQVRGKDTIDDIVNEMLKERSGNSTSGS